MSSKVLVTAEGSIVAQGIIKSLKLANKKCSKYAIIAADMSPLAAGLYRCDRGILIPPVSSLDYVDSIIQTCQDNDVQAIFCGSDDELLALASAKNRIEGKTGAKLLTGSLEALARQNGAYVEGIAEKIKAGESIEELLAKLFALKEEQLSQIANQYSRKDT